MEVILQEKIRKLGNLGDRVKVKPGYGRNYLIPYGKAVSATPENIKQFESRRAELEQKAQDKETQAQGRARALEEFAGVTIVMRSGDEGKLYGSVGPQEVSHAITEQTKIEVAKQEVQMPEGAIRHVGEHSVDLYLHTDLAIKFNVNVIPEEE